MDSTPLGVVESGLREHGLYATWLFMCFPEDKNNLSLTNTYCIVTPGKLSSLLIRLHMARYLGVVDRRGQWVWLIGMVSGCG